MSTNLWDLKATAIMKEKRRQELLNEQTQAALEYLPSTADNVVVVIPWREAPTVLQTVSCFGGDEDYIIIYHGDDHGIVNRLTVCDNKEVKLKHGISVAVTCHA